MNFKQWCHSIGIEDIRIVKGDMVSMCTLKECWDYQQERVDKTREDVREAVNTTWRFIGAYKKENKVPINLALESAEFHLKNVDYIFSDEDKE